MNLTFDNALGGLRAEAPGSHAVQVRLTIHGEDGLVLYGYGGLAYEPPPTERHRGGYVVDTTAILAANVAGIDGYAFEGERLATNQTSTPNNARLRVLNNQTYDTSRHGSWIPPDWQTFLVDFPLPEYWAITIGWAQKNGVRAIVLQASRDATGTFLSTRVEMVEEDVFLSGEGSSLYVPNSLAVWTVSFLGIQPLAANEIG